MLGDKIYINDGGNDIWIYDITKNEVSYTFTYWKRQSYPLQRVVETRRKHAKKILFYVYLLLMPWVILLLYTIYSTVVDFYPITISNSYSDNATILFWAHTIFLFSVGVLLSGILFLPIKLLKEKKSIRVCAVYTIIPIISAAYFYQYAPSGGWNLLLKVLFYAPLISGAYFVALLVGIKMSNKELK